MQKQKNPTSGDGATETADEMAGNKLAASAAANATAFLRETRRRTIKHYRCGSGTCRYTSQREGGVCDPIPVYED